MRLRYKVLSSVIALLALALTSLAVVMSHNSRCGMAPPLAANEPPMKAIVQRCYGSPDVLKLEDIARPSPVDDRMIIKVRAASANPYDWHMMRGEPYFLRAIAGFGAPKDSRFGVDFAGSIESVGKNVTKFKPGDAVFGGRTGAFAQYVSVAENGSLAMKPSNLTFEQAAAAPMAAVTALQALRDEGKLQPGQSVLINGASGGVGTFAVQIAKAYGARVTGVCSTRNTGMVRSIGADAVIDYTKEDFTQGTLRYDLIVDIVGSHSLSEYRQVLKPHGTLVMVGSQDKGHWIGAMSTLIDVWVMAPFVSQKFTGLMADLDPKDLDVLRDLMQSGKVTPVIDRSYALDEVAEAIRYVELGHSRGKVVIAVQQANP
jgi:NADPH:quinone reductase-like Zn-dependent oxidoreductase